MCMLSIVMEEISRHWGLAEVLNVLPSLKVAGFIFVTQILRHAVESYSGLLSHLISTRLSMLKNRVPVCYLIFLRIYLCC